MFSKFFGLFYWIMIIVLCIKDKIRWATFFALITTGLLSITIGLLVIFVLSDYTIRGSDDPKIPIIIGFVLFASVLYALKHSKKAEKIQAEKYLTLRWLILILGIIVQFIGCIVANMFIFLEESKPNLTVMCYIAVTIISVLLLYWASRINSIKRPNLMRKIVFICIFLVFNNITLLMSCSLLFIIPEKPPVAYPYLAGLTTICFLIYGVAFLFIKRDFIIPDSLQD